MALTEKVIVRRLEAEFTKDNLYQQWFTPIKSFLITNANSLWDGINTEYVVQGFDLKKVLNKTDLSKLCARFYASPAAVQAYYSQRPATWQEVMNEAAWLVEMDRQALETLFGKPILTIRKEKQSFYVNNTPELIAELKEWEPFITIEKRYNYYGTDAEMLKNTTLTLKVPALMRDIYQAFLPKPKGYDLEPVPKPEGKNIRYFTAEADIFRELPLVISWYMQGNIKYSQKGYPNPASVRKMQRTLQLSEFEPFTEPGIRSLMIAGRLADDFKIKSISESGVDLLRAITSRPFEKQPAAYYLLSHIKGINYFYHYDFHKEATDTILNTIKNAVADAWITFTNLKTFIASRSLSITPISHYQMYNKLSVEDGKKDQDISINRSNYRNYVDWPFVAGHLYLLAAFGMAELAIDVAAPATYSPYDGLVAFKITSLGQYLLGQTNTYEPPEQENPTQLLFDEASTIIRIEGNIELGDTMLANYAAKVSGNRYQFSPGKFLKDCKTVKDLQTKITLFKQTVGQKLPPYWNSYLQNLVLNSKAITLQSNTVVYSLPSDNKDLHRIVARDEVLSGIIIKAEQFRIIVEQTKAAAFVNRMKELGYLVE